MSSADICGKQRKEGLASWTSKREVVVRPRCNRIPEHLGPHRKIDRHTFAVLAEWEDGACVVPKQR